MKNKILPILCSLFMLSNMANADWIAGNTTVYPAVPITACDGMEVEGTFSWFTTVSYNNDMHVATMKILLPNTSSVIAATGVPTMTDVATNLPVPNVTFTLNASPGGASWEANFGPGTVIAPFTVLKFRVSNLGVVDTTLSGLLMSNTIDFLSSPPGETTANNGSSVNFAISANPSSLAPATSHDTLMQADGTKLSYYDPSCMLIATVDDGAGGTILGNTVSTVNVDAATSLHNGQPFVRRWYQIVPDTNGQSDVTIYVNQLDFDNYNTTVASPYLSLPTSGSNTDPNIANIHITRNDTTGLSNNPVVIIPTSVNWNGDYWEITFTTTSTLGQYRVHSANPGNIPLAVVYKKFTVTKQSSSDLVEWTTTMESNNDYFNVQRSADGVNFETLGKVVSLVAPNGNSSTELNYSFVDKAPMIGDNFYRLEQVDFNNKIAYSKNINIIWGTEGSVVSIYPNPATDILNIDLSTAKVSQTEIKLLDISGRVITSVVSQSVKGMNHIQINLGDIAIGVYGVQVFENNKLTHVSKVRKN